MTEGLTKQICYRVSEEVYEMMITLCYEEVRGVKIKVADISKYAREFMLRGMMSFFEEKDMVKEFKKLQQAKRNGV